MTSLPFSECSAELFWALPVKGYFDLCSAFPLWVWRELYCVSRAVTPSLGFCIYQSLSTISKKWPILTRIPMRYVKTKNSWMIILFVKYLTGFICIVKIYISKWLLLLLSQADEMIENLRSAMKELLGKNQWMDQETIAKAIQKVTPFDLYL